MIWILTSTARLLFRTEESIDTPCSVNAYGFAFLIPPRFEITNCDFKKLQDKISNIIRPLAAFLSSGQNHPVLTAWENSTATIDNLRNLK
jgi:hypothetical protein